MNKWVRKEGKPGRREIRSKERIEGLRGERGMVFFGKSLMSLYKLHNALLWQFKPTISVFIMKNKMRWCFFFFKLPQSKYWLLKQRTGYISFHSFSRRSLYMPTMFQAPTPCTGEGAENETRQRKRFQHPHRWHHPSSTVFWSKLAVTSKSVLY